MALESGPGRRAGVPGREDTANPIAAGTDAIIRHADSENLPDLAVQKSFRRLPHAIQERAAEQERIFIANQFDPRLDTHKTKGRLKGLWSYSVDFRYRVLFRFIDQETVIYYDIGDHSIYR